MKYLSLKSKSVLMFVFAGLLVILDVVAILVGLYSFNGIENRLWLIRKLGTNFYQIELHLQTVFLTDERVKQQNVILALVNEIEYEFTILKLGGYFQQHRHVDAPPTNIEPYLKEIEAQWFLTRKAVDTLLISTDPNSLSIRRASLGRAIENLQRLNQTIDLLTTFAENQHHQARKAHDNFLVALLIINLSAVILAGIIFYRNLLKPLQKVSKEVSSYLKNPTNARPIHYERKDEIGEIAYGFNAIADLLVLTSQNLHQIRHASSDELQVSQFLQHPVQDALRNTQKAFERLRQQQTEHNWQSEGITSFVNVLDNHGENLSEFAHAVLRFLTDYTRATAGALFIFSDDQQHTEYTVSWGVDVQESLVITNRGIIRRALQEKKPIILRSQHDDTLEVSSGLFSFKPVATVVVPFVSAQGHQQGVLEMVYDYEPADYQIRFFAEIADNITSAIAEVKYSKKMAEMLRKTQDLMHDLQINEEELRQNMEELLSSQEIIRQQMQRTEELKNELASRIAVLDETAIVSEADLYGNIVYANKKLLEITGYTSEELIGKPHNILRHPDTPSETFRQMWATIKSGNLFRAIIKNKKKDGSSYWVDAVVAPILDAEGKITKYISIRFDITEQIFQNQKIQELLDETAHQNKQLAEKEKQLRQSYAELQHSKELLDAYNASLEEKIRERTAEITLQKENIESSIRYAKRIQNAMLPTTDDIQAQIPECFILYKPKDVVSGDFYWFAKEAEKIFIIVADCTGHGVPGGFMSMIGMAKLGQIIKENKIEQPAKILDKLHEELFSALNRQTNTQVKDGMDMSICVIDKKQKELQFAGAHQSLLYIDNQGVLQIIKGDRNGIGGNYTQKGETFTQHILPLTPQRTAYYLFSDGITDQFGGTDNRKFGLKNLKELLEQIHTLEMPLQHYHISTTLAQWQANYKQTDDMLMIGMRV